MKYSYILYAPNVHQGGGRALLLPLLFELKGHANFLFVLDERLSLPEGMKLAGMVYRVAPDFFSRIRFEWWLKRQISDRSTVLCMGNLPPLFAHQGKQIVFLQNRYLLESLSLSGFPLGPRLRIRFERWWLRSRACFVRSFVVQTETMAKLLRQALHADVAVLPFIAAPQDSAEQMHTGTRYDFLYVATGEPHKNHRRLVEAWVILAEKGLYPSLCLTLNPNRFSGLCEWISGKISKHRLNIAIVGEFSPSDIVGLYRASKALIYPSIFESFGLPLIEAVHAGLPVLASERDYVGDVIYPSATFDPMSSASIAKAVAGFSFVPARLKITPLNAESFLAETLFSTEP